MIAGMVPEMPYFNRSEKRELGLSVAKNKLHAAVMLVVLKALKHLTMKSHARVPDNGDESSGKPETQHDKSHLLKLSGYMHKTGQIGVNCPVSLA